MWGEKKSGGRALWSIVSELVFYAIPLQNSKPCKQMPYAEKEHLPKIRSDTRTAKLYCIAD